MFYGAATDGVALVGRAVFSDTKLRHDEQRNAACAGRGIGLAGEDDMHDIPGQIVLAGSFIRPVEARLGDTIVGDFGPYGSVSLFFA